MVIMKQVRQDHINRYLDHWNPPWWYVPLAITVGAIFILYSLAIYIKNKLCQ